MKIDRLIGILAVLQNRKKTSAPYLAEKFEVSRRTISRDIEDLCKAGIPIVTTQGVSGGISLMEGFQLDKTIFTASELQSILIGLQSVDSISNTSYTKLLAEKLAADADTVLLPTECFVIDLSTFHKYSLTPKIETIRKAIGERRRVTFHYYYDKGEADKCIEPYLIIYKWDAWYLFGFCTKRQDYRMYKMNRLWDLRLTEETFQKRRPPENMPDYTGFFKDAVTVTAEIEESEKYRLVENYGPDCFTVMEDGRLRFTCSFNSEESMLSWLLSFGEKAELIDPPELREMVLRRLERMRDKYL